MGYLNAVVSEATGTLHRASEGIKITVDQHNILQAARIIEAEAAHFEKQLLARAEDLIVRPMGGDPVSEQAAQVLTYKFRDAPDSYVNRCREYATMLHDLAEQLGESAQTYGFTEGQVRTQFDAATLEGGSRPLDLAAPMARGSYGGLRAI
jgi:hypothetical protein